MTIKTMLSELIYFPSNIYNKLQMILRGIKYGKKLSCKGRIFIRGRGKIIIGDNVTINSCMASNPIGGSTRTILFSKKNGLISIGNNCGISNSAIVALNRIEIGNNVFIGGNCKIYDHDFHSLDYSTRLQPGNQGVVGKPIIIHDGAFIGGHSIILKGVTIGEESIVGAGSVVTKDIPAGEIWAGNPAKYKSQNKEI